MDADLDTLATALYVTIDDLLQMTPQRAPWRPAIGFSPQISDAELVTLAVMQALPGFTSESRWLRFATSYLHHLFPYLPQQSGYNKRLRNLAATISWLIGILARDTTLWTDDVWVVDSTPVECARSREATPATSGDYACTCSPPRTAYPWVSRSPAPKPTNERSYSTSRTPTPP